MKPTLVVATIVLAIVTAAANLYASLRTGYSFPMAPLAAIVAGLVLRGDARSRAAIVAVAAGASAAGYVPGGGNVPSLVALASTVETLSRGGWVLWFVFVSLLGLFAAAWLGAPKHLAFPTAKATADIADAMDGEAGRIDPAGRAKTRGLLLGMVGGAFIALLHAVRVLPSRLALPGRLGIELSALAFGIGPYVGVRVAASMAFAGAFTAALVAPRLVSAGLVTDPSWAGVVRFMLWPALGMVTTSACLAHALEWKAAKTGRTTASATKASVARALLPVVAITLALRVVFGVPWLAALATGPVTLLTILASIRAMGETDAVPVKALAPLTQVVAGITAPSSFVSAAIMPDVACAAGLSAADTATSLRTGGDARSILLLRALGIVVGAATTVVCLPWIIPRPELFAPTEALPAPSIVLWKSTAEVLSHGLAAVPTSARLALVLGAVVGAVLVLVERAVPPKKRMWLPSAVGLGGALVLPASLSTTIFAGALVGAMAKRRWSPELVGLVGAGAVAGESVASVLAALLGR